MCEPLAPINELRSLACSITALAQLAERGSFLRANLESATTGINARLAWVIANLEAAGEGNKNFGLSLYAQAPKPPTGGGK